MKTKKPKTYNTYTFGPKTRTQPYGQMSWRWASFSNRYDRFKNEEELLATFSEPQKRNYFAYKEKRLAKWLQSKFYQRSLRVTQAMLNKANKQRAKMLRMRFKNRTISKIEVPAEANAIIALACLKNGEK